ncbi:uncharacterized protein L201_007102 [Kwoniella dendrophila CBS 6074]|uniref:Knr4/Smi1-like domain-containing protein n=1 Tax=Kwoniella dendrophila CBS 6074 TaxID=1295534 RepID=A0AAX4K4X4_9TREE
MGTRGLLGLIISGKRKGCYNHFDSYPEGLGVDIVRFILGLSPEETETMVQRLTEIIWVTEDDPVPSDLLELYKSRDFHLDKYQKEQREEDPDNMSNIMRGYGGEPRNWYSLLRGIQGASCLPYILDGTLKHLIDGTDFEEDGLFCEWSYWINFEDEFFVMNDGEERKWNFNELDKGFWGKLVDDKIQAEREMEKRRKEFEPERKKQLEALRALRRQAKMLDEENAKNEKNAKNQEIVWVEDSDYMPADIRNNYLSKEFHFTTYEKKIRLTNAELFEFRVKNRLPYHRWYDLLIGMQYGQCLSSILDGSLKHLVNYPMDNSEYTYWIGFENETFGMLGLNLEGEWSFDQLDKGFWGKVVDDYNYWVKKDPYSPYIP